MEKKEKKNRIKVAQKKDQIQKKVPTEKKVSKIKHKLLKDSEQRALKS